MGSSGGKKIFSLAQTLLFVLIAAALASIITYNVAPTGQNSSDFSVQALYQNAIVDSMIAEPAEITPLVAITPNSDLVQWNATKDKVLLATWHSYPDSYPDGATVETSWGEVWTFLPLELKERYQQYLPEDIDDILRLEQLIGLPPQNGYTNFTTMWVSPKDIFRPSYDNEITDTTVQLQFAENADPSYVEWFEQNIIDSYYPGSYPWTRLGYTYDWSGDSTEYGLSEFVIKQGAQVVVEKTYTNEDFLTYLSE